MNAQSQRGSPSENDERNPAFHARDGPEQVVELSLTELYPFKNHPFHVVDDVHMESTAQSIKSNGVLVPVIVRPRAEGGYEIISGHRRKRACEMIGKETIPAIVRDLDDDAATLFMVDSNLQREQLLPSERAFAFKMKLDALKHQGKRTASTSAQVGLVDKSRLFCCNPIHRNKKDADGRHPIHLIILLRFMAAAERRQWSSAAAIPRRVRRVRL